MHSQFEELFVVLSVVPSVLVHLLAELVERIGIEGVRVGVGELLALFLGESHQLGSYRAGHLAALAQYHAPHSIVHHDEAALALCHREQVHQGDVLGVLAERCHQWRIADHRPYVLHLVEQGHEHVVGVQFGFALLLAQVVDGSLYAAQVGHHGPHHAAGQTAAEQEAGHVLVGGVDEVAEPVVDELLGEGTGLHVGVHVDFGHVEAFVLQHGLYGDDIRVHLAPGEGLDGRIDDVGTVVAHLEDACHREAGAAVTVVLDDDVGMILLYHARQLAEHGWLTDAGHVLQAYLGCTGLYQLVGNSRVVLGCMDGTGRDAKRGLRNHAALLGPADAGNDVADIVQAAEDAGNVGALLLLHLVHELPHIVGHRIHAQGIQAAVQHVRLDAYLIEGFAEGTDGLVGVLACQQVHLLECTAISLHTVKASHLDDYGGYAGQLIFARLELAAALPHVSIHEAETNFLFHYVILKIPALNFIGRKDTKKIEEGGTMNEELFLIRQYASGFA